MEEGDGVGGVKKKVDGSRVVEGEKYGSLCESMWFVEEEQNVWRKELYTNRKKKVWLGERATLRNNALTNI